MSIDKQILDNVKSDLERAEKRKERENMLSFFINIIHPGIKFAELILLYWLIFKYLPFWVFLVAIAFRGYVIFASIYVTISAFFGASILEDSLSEEEIKDIVKHQFNEVQKRRQEELGREQLNELFNESVQYPEDNEQN